MLVQGVDISVRTNVRCDIHRQKYICRKHIHHFAELVLVLDGKLNVTVNGKRETVTKNQFILLFPFQKHEYTSDDVSYFLICTFPISFLMDFAAKASGKSGNRAVFDASDLAVELFKQKLIEQEITTVYGINACLQAMLDDFTAQVELVKSNIDSSTMDKLASFMYSNYKEALPLSAVAHALGYSPNYLSHCIFKTLGMNYRSFLGSIRADHASNMLKKTDMPVLEIALECGYPNIRSFQRHFKALTGVSPSEYRKQIKKTYSEAIKVNTYPTRIRKDISIQ